MSAQWVKYNYAGRQLTDWNIYKVCGYQPISTYYTDFGIAEWYGADAIRDTYNNAISNWGSDIKWVTEIVMVLNWKIWEHYYSGNEQMAKFYDSLWRQSVDYVFEHFSGDDITYYLRTTD